MSRRRSGLAPLWVYIWGLFAVAVSQRFLFPPDERSVTANVAIFAVGAAVVVVVLTVLERVTHR